MSKTQFKKYIKESTRIVEDDATDNGKTIGDFIIDKLFHNVGTFWIDDHNITSMEGLPSTIHDNLVLRIKDIRIKNLIGMPEKFSSDTVKLHIDDCNFLTSLEGCTSNIQRLDIFYCNNLKKIDCNLTHIDTISVTGELNDLDMSSLTAPTLTGLSLNGGNNVTFNSKCIPKNSNINKLGLEFKFGSVKLQNLLQDCGINKLGVLYINSASNSDIIDLEGMDAFKFDTSYGISGESRLILKGNHKSFTGFSRILMNPGITKIILNINGIPDEIKQFIDSAKLPLSRKDIMKFTELCTEHDMSHLV